MGPMTLKFELGRDFCTALKKALLILSDHKPLKVGYIIKSSLPDAVSSGYYWQCATRPNSYTEW